MATETSDIRKVALASFIGSTLEWYDFFIFGTATALVFNKLFFPEFNPVTGMIAAFATFAVGFIARPLGGIVFGHFGDRIGRKKMLILSMTLMGVGSTLIGLLPTYDQIGIWAPILLVLLRVVQGISVGGGRDGLPGEGGARQQRHARTEIEHRDRQAAGAHVDAILEVHPLERALGSEPGAEA